MNKKRFVSTVLAIFLLIQSIDTYSSLNFLNSKAFAEQLQNDTVPIEDVNPSVTPNIPENETIEN